VSEIKCFVCQGHNFQKSTYEIDLEVDVDVNTSFHNDVCSSGEIVLTLESDNKNSYPSYSDVYKYVCEDCGFIMSFIKKFK
jgi:hypothetical protein